MLRNVILSGAVAGLLLAVPQAAEAYIGPGAGLTVIGTAVALVGAIVLGIVGFLWYPIKRLRARARDRRQVPQRDQEASSS